VLDAVQTALRKELGNDFKMHFDETINPVLHGSKADAAVIV
jgi:hypothetical protein